MTARKAKFKENATRHMEMDGYYMEEQGPNIKEIWHTDGTYAERCDRTAINRETILFELGQSSIGEYKRGRLRSVPFIGKARKVGW